MANNFLHGVETIEVQSGTRTVNIVKSGVIGLVGIAPQGPKNQLVLVTSDRDVAQFGKQLPGFNIPQTLDVILTQGAANVLVVNIFDETLHTAQVTDETKTVTAGALKLQYAPIGAVTIKDSEDAVVDYVLGTDYQIDEYGNFKVLSSEIPNATALKFSYKRLDLTTVNAAALIGEVNSTTGARSGIKCFDEAFNEFGFNPKIFISPGFSTLAAVTTELLSAATKFRGIVYIDAPEGTTVAEAIAGRGPAGSIENFNTSNKRAELVFPMLKKYNPATDTYENFPYSAYLAGIRAAVDATDGFWFSSSNREIKGAKGAEIKISAGASDVNSDANKLNEAGITTVFNTFGTGLRTWGNHNASFPINTGVDNFTNIVRIADTVHESLEQASLQFIDRPIVQGLIDTIRESGNAFMRTLIGRGALLPGSRVIYNPADNPPEELANGHLTFEISFVGPTPAERISFRSFLDINLFANIQ